MPYIPPEVVAQVREMDLLIYLRTYEPQEMVHFGGAPTAPVSTTAWKSPMANGAGFPVGSAAILRWTISLRSKRCHLRRWSKPL